jgi:small multidrug resistance family-3 protein
VRQVAGALVLIAAAILEVAGDAIIRKGLRSGVVVLMLAGVMLLGGYGLIVNALRIDFSKLLGVYVGVFAAASVLAGRLIFGDAVPRTTWIGLGIIVAGSVVIHLGWARG